MTQTETPLALTQKVSLSSQVLMQDLGGESVFLNCASEEYFGLDAIGTRMLAVLQASNSIAAAAQLLLDEYDVEADRLEQDLLAFVQSLLAHGLVEITQS
ncbi:MAG: PqqD family protein [Chloroflexaceae bacterium]|nr:PqqD family protein [Chloroflexaceae bacterium]